MASSHKPPAPKQGIKKVHNVSWPKFKSVQDWLKPQPVDTWKKFFQEHGYLVVRNLLEPDELPIYQDIYDKLITGEIDASKHRHDLGNHAERQQADKENICQIMWPCEYVEGLDKGPFHERSHAVALEILGSDVILDFEMMISKGPHTNTITPWHQDEAYWPNMSDKRAASCWCAMDDVDEDNGCMWFVPGSHKVSLREHHPVKPGVHVLNCAGSEDEGKPVPMSAGSCTFHTGQTMHYARGNTTDRNRRAYITIYRPQAMVEFERNEINCDHGKEKGIEIIMETGQAHEK